MNKTTILKEQHSAKKKTPGVRIAVSLVQIDDNEIKELFTLLSLLSGGHDQDGS